MNPAEVLQVVYFGKPPSNVIKLVLCMCVYIRTEYFYCSGRSNFASCKKSQAMQVKINALQCEEKSRQEDKSVGCTNWTEILLFKAQGL